MFNQQEYIRDYQRERARERVALARERLGGVCVKCGADENLEFDHIDPSTKVHHVSEAANWALERFLSEVDKCQLLCKPCHIEKTRQEVSKHSPWSRNRCYCQECKDVRSAYYKNRPSRKKID